jgi:hypothetical protein
MRRTLTALCLLLGTLAVAPADAGEPVPVVVQDPFIDLHTGPGRGFPATLSVPRGATVQLLRQRTDWIKVRTDHGKEGWVHRSQLERTLTPDGGEVRLAGPTPQSRVEHKWEAGVATGQFSGASVVRVNGAYAVTETLQVRVDASQLLGTYSNGWLGTVGISHVFMPQWRVSPMLGIGGGVVHIAPKATLVSPDDRTDTTAFGSLGLRGYLTDRFLLQAEYRSFVVFTSRDDNEEIDEWTVGFTYFF